MNIDEKIRSRLDELVRMGDDVIATRRMKGGLVVGDDGVDTQLAYQWATSVQNLLARAFGHESEHYKNFAAQVSAHLTYSPALRGQGILRAAKEDYEGGHLFEFRRLVEAELFDDFLEQAEHLMDSGFYQAAAVMAGGVLEDGLRKLCAKHSIVLSSHPKLDTMNAELAKLNMFSKLVQKRITTIADLRNKAAHGQWDQFTSDDAKEMLLSVRRLVEEYFS